MPDRWQQVQDIFEQAIERPAEQREALLAEACRGDPDLRAEVESLLRHHDESGDDFMRPPAPPPTLPPYPPQAGATPTSDEPDLLIGHQVGAFRIERILGVGGIGTVYLAGQQQPQRLVALKLLRPGVASTSALRRFEYEAEILAHLRHPNIAEVYQAGTHLGLPYFAMEYIPEARPITVCADQEGLDARGRLRLFEQVCEAVHHGHQRGVIHRDLKPANILVDGAGRVKVIDFGVARATDADIALTTLRTETGQLIGTLQYMSPEQCDADPHEIDVRTDVYSLGVVLYELLCGRLPYDVTRTPIPTAARVICEQAPPRPSSITGRRKKGTGSAPVGADSALRRRPAVPVPFFPVKGDLERIVLTALEKDRDRRYQSAADLLRDIRHYLNREPIEAKPPTPWTRAVRWMARHPAWATTAGCLSIAALVIVATCVSVWYMNMEPYRIVLLDRAGDPVARCGVEARLLARSRRILHWWNTEVGEITSAKLVDRPAESGGGQLAVIGFANAVDRLQPGALCAYEVGRDLDVPLWRGEIQDSDLPDDIGEDDFIRQRFNLCYAWALDVFRESPGPEIIAIHGNAYSQRAIRIYDLDGNVLYQVWHDGSLSQCYWMSGENLLVFAGDNGQGHRGRYGRVIFAVRPERGVRKREYLDTRPNADSSSPLTPAWYRALLPEQEVSRIAWLRLRAPTGMDGRRFVTVDIGVPANGEVAGFARNVNGRGEFFGKPLLGDAWQTHNLPKPEIFYLGPPPVDWMLPRRDDSSGFADDEAP